ncbi:hypothetical protein, conserved, (fragment), partial [Trypanosoma brucei gambiense DAL972]
PPAAPPPAAYWERFGPQQPPPLCLLEGLGPQQFHPLRVLERLRPQQLPPPVPLGKTRAPPPPPPPAPTGKTQAPAAPPPAPTGKTQAPAAPPPAPTGKTQAPAAPPPAPTGKTQAPAAPPPAPTGKTQAPAAPPPAPTGKTQAPAAPPPAPTGKTQAPAAPPPAPTGKTQAPAAPPPVPTGKTQAPAAPPPAPTGKTQAPAAPRVAAQTQKQQAKKGVAAFLDSSDSSDGSEAKPCAGAVERPGLAAPSSVRENSTLPSPAPVLSMKRPPAASSGKGKVALFDSSSDSDEENSGVRAATFTEKDDQQFPKGGVGAGDLARKGSPRGVPSRATSGSRVGPTDQQKLISPVGSPRSRRPIFSSSSGSSPEATPPRASIKQTGCRGAALGVSSTAQVGGGNNQNTTAKPLPTTFQSVERSVPASPPAPEGVRARSEAAPAQSPDAAANVMPIVKTETQPQGDDKEQHTAAPLKVIPNVAFSKRKISDSDSDN